MSQRCANSLGLGKRKVNFLCSPMIPYPKIYPSNVVTNAAMSFRQPLNTFTVAAAIRAVCFRDAKPASLLTKSGLPREIQPLPHRLSAARYAAMNFRPTKITSMAEKVQRMACATSARHALRRAIESGKKRIQRELERREGQKRNDSERATEPNSTDAHANGKPKTPTTRAIIALPIVPLLPSTIERAKTKLRGWFTHSPKSNGDSPLIIFPAAAPCAVDLSTDCFILSPLIIGYPLVILVAPAPLPLTPSPCVTVAADATTQKATVTQKNGWLGHTVPSAPMKSLLESILTFR